MLWITKQPVTIFYRAPPWVAGFQDVSGTLSWAQLWKGNDVCSAQLSLAGGSHQLQVGLKQIPVSSAILLPTKKHVFHQQVVASPGGVSWGGILCCSR